MCRTFGGAGAQSTRWGMVRCEAGERDVRAGSEKKELRRCSEGSGEILKGFKQAQIFILRLVWRMLEAS